MDELVLRLLPDNQEPQELVLQQHRLETSILDAATAALSYVFNDYKYRAQLVNANTQIRNLIFLLNGKEVKVTYSQESGLITFQDLSFGQRIFLECYGFVQITIVFDDEQGIHQVKETEYIQVMVRKGWQNDSVRRMTEYIYKYNSEILNGDKTHSKDISGLKDSARKTIESQILLLEQISVIYEENYRYFKMNSRFVTTPKERVDHFEKLQYVSRNTLQYIAQHPEELQQVWDSSGIKVGNFRYQPNKTLITDNTKSYNIYENRVVLGFLIFLLHEVERIQKDLTSIVNGVPQKLMETDDYITSSYFIYAKTIESVKIILKDIQNLHRKYTTLYNLYSKILPIKPEIVMNTPQFTPLFRSIPQYHQVYDCVSAWFSKGMFTICEEQFMLSFIKTSALYEIYVLTKLINYFHSIGYALISTNKITYPSPGRYYENTYCNNCFVFKNDAGQVTLYYQPVIYNTNRQSISGIGLYRNTSISFPKLQSSGNYGGRYYTPDFVIKYEYANVSTARYLIADAKFSRLQTVKNREVAELAYKYLFSISPVSQDDLIVGLCIFNGQSDIATDSYTNIYDHELTQRITPRADIVTLTENSINNAELHEALLRNSVGLYTTEIPQKIVPLPANTESQLPGMDQVETPVVTDLSTSSQQGATETTEFREDESSVRHTVQTNLTIPNSAIKIPSKANGKNNVDIATIKLSELKLDKKIEEQLALAGYVTVRDLLPNGNKSDLAGNTILNRKCRREIEARLKRYKVYIK